jgi:hypothetical protein
LPQIAVADPDWLFWAAENVTFDGDLKHEIELIAVSIR